MAPRLEFKMKGIRYHDARTFNSKLCKSAKKEELYN
jgi:hypothetical protein